MKDKVVVVGGAGFLGSHLADELSDAGYHVVIYDRQQSPWARADQEMVLGEITDSAKLTAALSGARYVYHLAGIAEIAEANQNPVAAIETNIIGSTRVIEACIKAKVERFLFASTVYVYSDKGSFYRVTKQATELIVEAYADNFGLTYTFLRYGSLYGPRAQPWNSLKNFVSQGVRDGRIVYPGTGHERREYIHVKDAARLSVEALDSKGGNECLTITGAQIMTTAEMLAMVGEILGTNPEITFELDEEASRGFHYTYTPYRYTPRQGRKVVPQQFIDIGQGILELIEETHLDGDGS